MRATLLIVVAIGIQVGSSHVNYDGYQELSLHLVTNEQFLYLTALEQTKDGLKPPELIFLTEPNLHGVPIVVLVSPVFSGQFVNQLEKRDISNTISHPNIGELLQSENTPKLKPHLNGFAIENSFFEQYHRYSEITTFLQGLQSTHANIFTLESIGKSGENRDIWLVKISSNGAAKPTIIMDGGIHAREWLSPATVLYIINSLVDGYSTDNSEIKQLVDLFDWYFVPLLNPDGYEYSHTHDRMWRKNRNPNCQTSNRKKRVVPPSNPPQRPGGDIEEEECCVGVDLNRNFEWKWGSKTVNKDTCSSQYAGSSVYSEPEAVALRDLMQEHLVKVKAYVTVHTFGQEWLLPYGHSLGAKPSDYDQIKQLFDLANAALKSVRGTEYAVGAAWDLLGYTTAGTSRDWAKGTMGVKYACTMELSTAFITPASNILADAHEVWIGIKAMAQQLLAEEYVCIPQTPIAPGGCVPKRD